MKKSTLLLALFFSLYCSSCVQKSYEQTLILKLVVSDIKDIKMVGVRGEGKPMSWDSDILMKEISKDSLYEVEIKQTTGYLFTEIKFTVNGEFELKDKSNRRIVFDPSHKTVYEAKYNVEK